VNNLPKTYPPINYEAIKRVLDRIEANPNIWNQSEWHCGTSHCFAGHAQIDAGLPENWNTTRTDARIHFGFTQSEANYYFCPYRSLEELKNALIPLDENGFYRNGFNRGGFNCNGFNRGGFNYDGLDCGGFDRYGFNRDGFDRDGFDSDGLNIANKKKVSK
jgi:hypothetical protein